MCGKWFSTKQNLNVHVRDIHSTPSQGVQCKYCAKVCKSLSALRMHMRRYCPMSEQDPALNYQ